MVAVSSERSLLFVSHGTTVDVFSTGQRGADSLTKTCSLSCAEEINQIKVGRVHGQEVLLACDESGTVNVFFLASLGSPPLLTKNTTRGAWSLSCCDQEAFFASGSNEHVVTCYNMIDGHRRGPPMSAHQHNIPCIDVTDDGRFLAAGSIDRTLSVWDTREGRNVLLGRRKLCKEWIWSIRFIRKSALALLSSDDVRAWADIAKHLWEEGCLSNRQRVIFTNGLDEVGEENEEEEEEEEEVEEEEEEEEEEQEEGQEAVEEEDEAAEDVEEMARVGRGLSDPEEVDMDRDSGEEEEEEVEEDEEDSGEGVWGASPLLSRYRRLLRSADQLSDIGGRSESVLDADVMLVVGSQTRLMLVDSHLSVVASIKVPSQIPFQFYAQVGDAIDRLSFLEVVPALNLVLVQSQSSLTLFGYRMVCSDSDSDSDPEPRGRYALVPCLELLHPDLDRAGHIAWPSYGFAVECLPVEVSDHFRRGTCRVWSCYYGRRVCMWEIWEDENSSLHSIPCLV